MATLRELMETTTALEKATMALYACYARVFSADSKLHEFWHSMARDEAGHVGALTLVSTMLEVQGLLDEQSPLPLDDAAISRLRVMLERERAAAQPGLTIQRALAAALEVEESEIEDQVGALLKAVHQNDEYERYQRLLIHDMSDLSYMIESYCEDPALLARCDALVERHAQALHGADRH
ncbi:MAG TPA: hypothetical protein VKV28_10525 [Candidatus Binataceae bacterium]|nr:hypothetical protein [Candidatus Binataceae bacterium]